MIRAAFDGGPMADHLVIGILVGMAFGIAAILIIAGVTLRRVDLAQRAESVRVQRELSDLQRTVRHEAGAVRRDVEVFTQGVRDERERAAAALRDDMEALGGDMMKRLQASSEALAERLAGLTEAAVGALREHPMPALARLAEAQEQRLGALTAELTQLAEGQDRRLGALAAELTRLAAALESRLDQVETRLEERLREILAATRESLDQLRAEAAGHAKDLGNDFLDSLKAQADRAGVWMAAQTESHRRQLDELRADHAGQLAQITGAVDARLEHLRAAVDDTLERTVENRLGERFRLVSEQLDQVSARLEDVHRGLGEVQSFAAGLGHLQRAVATVRLGGTRGRGDKGAAAGEAGEGGGRGRAGRRKLAPIEAEPAATP
jgi:DNA anti-recombination protein RmuC